MSALPPNQPRLKSTKPLLKASLFLLGFLLVYVVIVVSCENDTETDLTSSAPPVSEPAPSSKSGVYEISLNSCFGKDLKQPATFYLDTKSTQWVLDYHNGEKITYTLISGHEDDPLCGLKARDSNGDRCELCFDISDRNNVKIRFDYGSLTLRCSGKIK